MEFKALNNKYNPEGSELRRYQLELLEILEYLDNVCRKHGIEYWLSSGTLLGAVRHGGFIPWDDDCDIEMRRDDYLKLLKILKENANNNYVLQTYKTDKYFVLPFAKLRNTKILINENNTELYKYKGAFVDIFPLERNSYYCLKFTALLHYVLLFKKKPAFIPICIQKVLIVLFKMFFFGILYPVLRLVNKFVSDKTLLYHTYGIGFLKKRVIKDIYPLQEIYFENKKFYAPNNTDSYLKEIYGDYMKIPNIDKIQNHSISIL